MDTVRFAQCCVLSHFCLFCFGGGAPLPCRCFTVLDVDSRCACDGKLHSRDADCSRGYIEDDVVQRQKGSLNSTM
ncbi:hypothetical protein BWQ96_04196 [Gracilariopsis chorda]|uniref:Secreted protein n=1 Tax=Gracilariopsis chorda TaxID=448386 RepID=A0A2V3IV74_9FLOR|nr:hypothetical protein BWQ96_04196 [Gracilariopsis chorda]|eukprot:PXF46021.1 hypothetical protein BWQ96_04196 [Gracilariopsis chorda]